MSASQKGRKASEHTKSIMREIHKSRWEQDYDHLLNSVTHKGIEAAKSDSAKRKRITTLQERYGVDNPGRLSKRCPYSKISQRCFDSIANVLGKGSCRYATNGGEYRIGNLSVDFLHIPSRTIIEFKGDIYHGNPSIFSESDKPNPFKDLTCGELWANDEARELQLEKEGYRIIDVWESEFRKNRKQVVEELLRKCK